MSCLYFLYHTLSFTDYFNINIVDFDRFILQIQNFNSNNIINIEKSMNKILFKPIGKLLGSYAFKPAMATPIMTMSKKNLYYNFATTKDPKN